MEEVNPAATPEPGQFPSELPDPLGAPANQPPNSAPQPRYEARPPQAPMSRPLMRESSAPNTTSMHNSNLEATYDINTLPRPIGLPENRPQWPAQRPPEGSLQAETAHPYAEPAQQQPETTPQPEAQQPEAGQPTPEVEFDKRNERLRTEPVDNDDIAAAGMVALGDVLKNRQVPTPPKTPHARAVLSAGAGSTFAPYVANSSIAPGSCARLVVI